MALVPCSECGKEISDKASTCPSCGAPVNATKPSPRPRGAPFIVDEAAPTTRLGGVSAPHISPADATVFRHPRSGQTVDISQAWAYTLLFGFFYFAVRGIWTHAVAGAALALVTAGISWILYPFFAKKIVRNHLLVTGWQPIS